MQKLGLIVDPNNPFKVRLDDGNRKTSKGCCRQVVAQLGEYGLLKDFFSC